jgi:DNA modification methylase
MKQEIEQIKTADLVPYARNAKKHDEAQVAKLAGSIREFGFNNPVLIDAANGIIAGHGRVMAAQKLALASVPCLRLSHLSETQKRAYILADNRLAELGGGWDGEMLKLELADLGDLDVDLDGIGFGADDLQDLEISEELEASEVDAEPQIDKAEELRAKWGVEPGQLWELGDHRLLCGDSTKKEDVERVMGGTNPDVVWTDPPYGFNYKKKSDGAQIQNDGQEFAAVIAGALAAASPALAYICGDAKTAQQFLQATSALGSPKACIVWKKPIQHRMHKFEPCHEFVWYWGDNGGPFYGPNVFEGRREIEKYHPTIKPVELVAYCLSAQSGDTVLDFFSGSGTTIIACEQLGRKCRAIEISPAYVAVALQRWADATGKTPKLVA